MSLRSRESHVVSTKRRAHLMCDYFLQRTCVAKQLYLNKFMRNSYYGRLYVTKLWRGIGKVLYRQKLQDLCN